MLFSIAVARNSIASFASVPPAMTSRFAKSAVLCAFALILAAPDTAEAAKPKLTCSFIQKQCVKECSKQMDKGFCSVYCADKQAMCMQTGRWDGIQRQFDNVRRR